MHDVIAQARANGAYVCAPRELALAESHSEFAYNDATAGNYFGARREVKTADENAKIAFENSPKARCNPDPVKVVKLGDRDHDKILDNVDKCPDQPEDYDGFQDQDGCPEPDNDQDGILDGDDKCPNEAGPKENDGCPDKDRDGDGIVDRLDKCPDDPGPKENDGCPDKDRDGDTVVDRLDNCPDVPGDVDNHGCPKQKFIVVTKEKIELKQKVHFATDKARILPDSFAMLTEIADVLKARPEIRVRIEGHTDSRGSMKHNMKLSQARADSVTQFLIGKGVDSTHMEPRGFGPTQPVGENRARRPGARRTGASSSSSPRSDPPLITNEAP